MISFGGWSGSKHFSTMTATPAGRQRFADSVLDRYFRKHPGLFDGVDIDWEFPVNGGQPSNHRSVHDGANLVLLLSTLRLSLDRLSSTDGRHYSLAIAATGDIGGLVNLKLSAIFEHVDWMGIMAYDFYAGSSVTGFNAALFRPRGDPSEHKNVDAVVGSYIRAGSPVDKLVLGIPFYGRAVGEVRPIAKGRFQSGNPKKASSWGGLHGIGYRELVERKPEKAGFIRFWDPKGKVPWLFNRERGIFISYEDARSVAHKATYARQRRLAGVMVWELGADKAGTLISATSRSFLTYDVGK